MGGLEGDDGRGRASDVASADCEGKGGHEMGVSARDRKRTRVRAGQEVCTDCSKSFSPGGEPF